MSKRSMENTIREIMAASQRTLQEAVAFDLSEETIGGKQYKNMHLCRTAIEKFKDDIEKKGNDPKIHKAIAAVNDYLGVEARVLDRGHATEDDVEAVKAGVEKAKEAISAAGLSGHDYHGLHIKAVERKVKKNETVDPSDTGGAEETSMGLKQIAAMHHFLDGIEERIKAQGDMEEWYQNKLTKANDYLKSLYSYGKGDMDDDENEVNEVSKGTLGSYMKKAVKQVQGNQPSDKDALRKRTNREKGLKTAASKSMNYGAKVAATEEVELEEKALSKAQQMAAGAALAAKRGEGDPDKLQGASKEMYKTMTTKELEDFARTKHKGLPDKKESVEEAASPKEVKMAIGVASDPRYKKGNYSGAVDKIEKIKKGLSNHPQVAAVLKRQNENVNEEPADRLMQKRKSGSDYMQKPGESEKVRDSNSSSEIQRLLLKKLQKSGKATDVQKRLQRNLSKNEENEMTDEGTNLQEAASPYHKAAAHLQKMVKDPKFARAYKEDIPDIESHIDHLKSNDALRHKRSAQAAARHDTIIRDIVSDAVHKNSSKEDSKKWHDHAGMRRLKESAEDRFANLLSRAIKKKS